MKICLILVDGMRPDALASLPEGKALLERAQSTLEARTVFPSVTLPCHMSLFHSVDPDRHGTTTNTYMPQVRPISGLCEALKRGGKTSAFFYDWEELRDLTRPDSLKSADFVSGHCQPYAVADDILTERALERLKEDVDFAFLYQGNPDSMGHKHGWMSDEYLAAVSQSLRNATRLIDSLGEEWLFIITADHGGHARIHGSEMPEDMTIPLLILGSVGETKFNLTDASIKDIAPTIAALLGVAPDPEWEGKILY